MKKKHCLIFSISIILIVQSFMSIASTLENQAVVNPGHFFDNFTESTCRSCHSSDVANRHHLLVQAGTYNCEDCHPSVTNSNGGNDIIIVRDCTKCHGTTFYNITLPLPHQNCTRCHTAVTSADLGIKHSNFTGNQSVESIDCKTCHYGPVLMAKGGANNNNTYFCADCHTAAGTSPNKSTNASVIFMDKKHGEASCMDCHRADGIYHQDNPRGSVANSTYVSRYRSTNTKTTDCADCHRAANLDDAPFYAPGGGTHIGESCSGGGCHGPSGTVIKVIHNVNPLDSATKKPSISTPALDHSTVTQGIEVNITATVNLPAGYGNALVDGAQYRIMSGLTEIRSWTPMTASDGNFNSILEVASGRINTNNLSGIYSIEVRGMGGGPSQNASIRYYPMNGDVSTIKNANLTVLPPVGYLNVTVTSGGVPVPEASVWINSNDIKTTDANGNYSFRVSAGTYSLTASKQPTHDDNMRTGIVTEGNTTILPVDLWIKPTGTISGAVTNA